jgi:hypothetical protein
MLFPAARRLSVITICLTTAFLALVVESNIGDTSQCLPMRYEPEFGCKNETLVIDYSSFGVVECGASYTVSETQAVPTIKLSSAEPDSLYTVMFVDTADTM